MMLRYPAQLDAHEDEMTRLDDHLTEDEMQARLATLDRMAAAPDPLGIVGVETMVRHGYGRAALGLLGIVVTVCGLGALLYGLG